jgi:hypothetical protein
VGLEGSVELDNIYHGVKPYKIKRLFFSKYWRSLYNKQHPFSLGQYEHKIATHCWLQRLTADDIVTIMGWWYSKHNINGNFWYLRRVVIPETYHWTRKTVREQRKAENQKAKCKRLEKLAGEQNAGSQQ